MSHPVRRETGRAGNGKCMDQKVEKTGNIRQTARIKRTKGKEERQKKGKKQD